MHEQKMRLPSKYNDNLFFFVDRKEKKKKLKIVNLFSSGRGVNLIPIVAFECHISKSSWIQNMRRFHPIYMRNYTITCNAAYWDFNLHANSYNHITRNHIDCPQYAQTYNGWYYLRSQISECNLVLFPSLLITVLFLSLKRKNK